MVLQKHSKIYIGNKNKLKKYVKKNKLNSYEIIVPTSIEKIIEIVRQTDTDYIKNLGINRSGVNNVPFLVFNVQELWQTQALNIIESLLIYPTIYTRIWLLRQNPHLYHYLLENGSLLPIDIIPIIYKYLGTECGCWEKWCIYCEEHLSTKQELKIKTIYSIDPYLALYKWDHSPDPINPKQLCMQCGLIHCKYTKWISECQNAYDVSMYTILHGIINNLADDYIDKERIQARYRGKTERDVIDFFTRIQIIDNYPFIHFNLPQPIAAPQPITTHQQHIALL